MGYSHDFTGDTHSLRSVAPVEWRQFENSLVAHWQAAGDRGATGRYVSANPRLSIFFHDMSSISATTGHHTRHLARAIFIPAGMPLRTCFSEPLSFAHVDIHIDHAWAVQVLTASLPRSAATRVLDTPVELDDISHIEPLARTLVGELREPRHHDLFAETLITSIMTGVLDLRGPTTEDANARLTGAQMRKVQHLLDSVRGQRLSTAQMAAAVNLSPSWFSLVFRNTTGMTPHQWQLNGRIDKARELLSGSDLSVADIADRLGFSDQAHLTRAFRRIVGETPASWRRSHARRPFRR